VIVGSLEAASAIAAVAVPEKVVVGNLVAAPELAGVESLVAVAVPEKGVVGNLVAVPEPAVVGSLVALAVPEELPVGSLVAVFARGVVAEGSAGTWVSVVGVGVGYAPAVGSFVARIVAAFLAESIQAEIADE
jgi:hypothetical protein